MLTFKISCWIRLSSLLAVLYISPEAVQLKEEEGLNAFRGGNEISFVISPETFTIVRNL